MLFIELFGLIVSINFINSYPLQFDHNAPSNIFEMKKKVALKQKTLSRGYAKDLLETQKWTNGIVPYTIDNASYSADDISIIYSGMKLIEDSTRVDGKDCIKFVKRTTQTTYLSIFDGTGCWSYLGKVFTGAQQLSLKIPTQSSPGSCLFTGTVAHEFDHEHVRPDRNSFVRINWNKIQPDATRNFQIVSNGLDLVFSDFPQYVTKFTSLIRGPSLVTYIFFVLCFGFNTSCDGGGCSNESDSCSDDVYGCIDDVDDCSDGAIVNVSISDNLGGSLLNHTGFATLLRLP
ncbi:hypothetical protein BpHYR1_046627 [Brachionus plicatilis]|uniref:Peptidase M12A domain-containing protein n=1 Tax=Brachionus plicatilis TaxID=10195 RepID=A0A3M7Q7P0_BRAPC|nr:hypothetical protein BpHYR1_046627 [Brachionus plicatilis]